MKIVDLQTLRSMPQGTLYQKYAPCYFKGMAIFDGALGESDFIACEFGDGPVECDSSEQFVERCEDMAGRGASYPVDLNIRHYVANAPRRLPTPAHMLADVSQTVAICMTPLQIGARACL